MSQTKQKQMTIKNMIGVDLEVAWCQVYNIVKIVSERPDWQLTPRQQTILDLLLAGF